MKGWNIFWERKGLGVAFPGFRGFPGDSDGKDSACTALDLIPELKRSPGEGNGNPLQYSGLVSMDGGAWLATVHGITKRRTQWRD